VTSKTIHIPASSSDSSADAEDVSSREDDQYRHDQLLCVLNEINSSLKIGLKYLSEITEINIEAEDIIE